jgi:hypothetical protein
MSMYVRRQAVSLVTGRCVDYVMRQSFTIGNAASISANPISPDYPDASLGFCKLSLRSVHSTPATECPVQMLQR